VCVTRSSSIHSAIDREVWGYLATRRSRGRIMVWRKGRQGLRMPKRPPGSAQGVEWERIGRLVSGQFRVRVRASKLKGSMLFLRRNEICHFVVDGLQNSSRVPGFNTRFKRLKKSVSVLTLCSVSVIRPNGVRQADDAYYPSDNIHSCSSGFLRITD
jgi:hypothetical protein